MVQRYQFAHPVTVRLWLRCGKNATLASLLSTFVNESHQIHRRAQRLDFLQGDIWPVQMSPALDVFVELDGSGFPVLDDPECSALAYRTFCFYSAWAVLLQGVRNGRDAVEGSSTRVQRGMMLYGRYLFSKAPDEALLLQEAQLAKLFRHSQAVRTGTQSHQCTCELNFHARLGTSLRVFRDTFRSDHVAPGGTSDPVRDAFAAGFKTSTACPQGDAVWNVEMDLLSDPPEDQISHPDSACLPLRILNGIICGQSALLHGMTQWAQDSFVSVRNMLIFAVDCFDEEVFGRFSGIDVGLLDLFAYLGRLLPEVHPDPDGFSTIRTPLKSRGKPRTDRLLTHAPGSRLAMLPALCVDGQGRIALSRASLPELPRHGLHLHSKMGADSLAPVEITNFEEKPAADSSEALFMRVDTVSWTNLGHALHFILPYIFAAFSETFASGGLQAVWRRRQRLRLYVALPGNNQDVLHRRRHPHLLPWLSLLSSEPPVFLPDAGQPGVDFDLLPEPLRLAPDGLSCHFAGIWGGAAAVEVFTKAGYDLFADIARSFPAWQVDRPALARKVWGKLAAAPGSTEDADAGATDPCVDFRTTCIRVLVVQRGAFAKKKRSVVNLDDAVRQLRAAHGERIMRVAVVQMEDFTLQEEIALAAMTDVFVGSMGSAMWWPIFMPEGAYVVWLLPKPTDFRAFLNEDGFGGLTKPLWSKTGLLEYRQYRNLWHVSIYGKSPSQPLEGNFEPDPVEDQESVLGILDMDVFLDIGQLLDAFAAIVRHFGRRFAINATRSSLRDS